MRRMLKVILAGALIVLPAFSQGHVGDFSRVAAQAQKLTFDADFVFWAVAIKPGKGPDFEKLMAQVKDALMKSANPERKAQAAGWKVVKSPTAMPDGNTQYVHIISPVVKGADYTILAILYEANTDPAQQTLLFTQYRDALAGTLAQAPFVQTLDFSK